MTTAPDSYQPPVNRLLELGDPREEKRKRDYLALGLGAEHVPDLIRMAQDDSLNTADSESLEVWAPLHAWRTLGQLRAEAAIEPLLGLLHRIDDNNDDSVGEDLPEVFGQIGPAAIGPLEQYAASSQNPTYARAAAAGGLRQIGKQHPGARDAAVAALTRLLDNYAEPGRLPDCRPFGA
jgi:HEAT repeat protein